MNSTRKLLTYTLASQLTYFSDIADVTNRIEYASRALLIVSTSEAISDTQQEFRKNVIKYNQISPFNFFIPPFMAVSMSSSMSISQLSELSINPADELN
jgi:hypothetical protein